MQMVFNAAKLTPFNGVEDAVDSEAFSDYNAMSPWLREAVDFNLAGGLIPGFKRQDQSEVKYHPRRSCRSCFEAVAKAKLVN